MKIITFNFPTFEDWLKNQNFEQEIGAYRCYFKLTHYSYTTEVLYQAFIVQYYWNDRIVVFKSTMSCFPNDYYQLKKWYNCVIVKINKKWREYILKTYFDVIEENDIQKCIKDLYTKYRYFCIECPKMHDFSCSGADSAKCQIKKEKILEEIKKLKSQLD